jgi:eukaryotic-like serine/threonine-protein kinase
VIEQATSEAPEARYAAASELEADLNAWLKTRPVAARGGGLGYRFGRLVQRNKSATALTAAALLVLVGSSIWFTWQLAEERDLAQAALKETEAALARAEDLREFLVDLFRAAEPDRPRDQLPSTEELARPGRPAGPGRRRRAPGRTPGHAAGPRRGLPGPVPERRRRAVDRRGGGAGAGACRTATGGPGPGAGAAGPACPAKYRMAEAEEWLLEAEALAAEADAGWNTYASIREYRAQLTTLLGNRLALEMIDPVHFEIRPGGRSSPGYITSTDADVRVERSPGRSARALEFRNQAAELVERTEGVESLAHAIEHRHRAELLLRMGRFDAAEDNLINALALYDRITEHPNQRRALAQLSFGWLLFYTGRYEQALDRIRQSNEEWAAAQGLTVAEFGLGFDLIGQRNADIQRWEEAEQYLRKAQTQLAESGPELDRRLNSTEIALAFVACHQGRIEEGVRLLAEVHARISKERPDTTVRGSRFLTARAACRYHAGEQEQALDAIDRALEKLTEPGFAMIHAERRILRARILVKLGRNREATVSLDQAQRQLEAVGLPEHPVMKRIHHLF